MERWANAMPGERPLADRRSRYSARPRSECRNARRHVRDGFAVEPQVDVVAGAQRRPDDVAAEGAAVAPSEQSGERDLPRGASAAHLEPARPTRRDHGQPRDADPGRARDVSRGGQGRNVRHRLNWGLGQPVGGGDPQRRRLGAAIVGPGNSDEHRQRRREQHTSEGEDTLGPRRRHVQQRTRPTCRLEKDMTPVGNECRLRAFVSSRSRGRWSNA